MSALAVYISSEGGYGDLELLRWDAASLEGEVLFGGAIGPGGIGAAYQITHYLGGAYFAMVTVDAAEENFEWGVFKLDLAQAACQRVLTLPLEGFANEVSGVACSKDGEKVFVWLRKGSGDASFFVSSDGGGGWVETLYSGLGLANTATLLYDDTLGRLFRTTASDAVVITSYSDNDGDTWVSGTFLDVDSGNRERASYGLLRQSKVLGWGDDAVDVFDTQALSSAVFRSASWFDEIVFLDRGYFSPNDGNYYSILGGAGVSASFFDQWASACTEESYASALPSGWVGDVRYFENPNGTLCYYVPASGAIRHAFVTEGSPPSNPPFWRRFVGAREIP